MRLINALDLIFLFASLIGLMLAYLNWRVLNEAVGALHDANIYNGRMRFACHLRAQEALRMTAQAVFTVAATLSLYLPSYPGTPDFFSAPHAVRAALVIAATIAAVQSYSAKQFRSKHYRL